MVLRIAYTNIFICTHLNSPLLIQLLAQFAGAIEYTDCTSAER